MERKEKNFISAVIYVHNAEGRIGPFLQNLIKILKCNFEKSEIICVNDASDDRSVSEIKDTGRKDSDIMISILNMSYFHGLESAMNAGLDLSIGDFVLEFDSALQDFDDSEIMRIYHKSLEGYDIVSACPDCKSKLTSRIFYGLFNRLAHFSYKMRTERFRILSRRVINRISSMNKTVPYRKAVYSNCGLKTIALQYECRQTGKVSADRVETRYRTGLATEALILFTDVGFRFSVWMTGIMMFVAIFMAAYSLVVYLTSNPVAGWTTTILFLSFAFFGLFGILTIIIKYLQIIVDLVFKRKKYSFESIEKITG